MSCSISPMSPVGNSCFDALVSAVSLAAVVSGSAASRLAQCLKHPCVEAHLLTLGSFLKLAILVFVQ